MIDLTRAQEIKPFVIEGFLLLIWGWQFDLLWLAAPMAILLEARYFVNRRWDLQPSDFYRVADLVTLMLGGLILFLILSTSRKHFVIELVQWLPVVLYPLVLAYAYSTSEKMSLDVIFYSLRRQKEKVKQFWDMDYVFLAACLVAIATSQSVQAWFFVLAATILGIGLYKLRSPRYSVQIWLFSLLLVISLAFGIQIGLRQGHLWIKKQTATWIGSWVRNRIDPLRVSTSLGYVGQLKLSDTILFRIKTTGAGPFLLQEAVYDLPSGTDWLTVSSDKTTVTPSSEFNWLFSRGESNQSNQSATVYLEFDREKDIVPVPEGLTSLRDFPADRISQTTYGTLIANGLFPTAYYQMDYNDVSSLNTEIRPTDLYFPEEYETTFASIRSEIDDLSDQQTLEYVQSFFSGFSYSLYHPEQIESESPLNEFLNVSKSGHCEYFASATVLMLRYLGIPARYVVGYSVQEYDSNLDMYVVRKMHAHAWAIAWIDGRWRTLDTTPATWLDIETDNRAGWGHLKDYFSRGYFLFQRWWEEQEPEDYKIELAVLAMFLIALLVWRLSRSQQVFVNRDSQNKKELVQDFSDLPLYQLEKVLSDNGLSRYKGELLTSWLIRTGFSQLLPWVNKHYKWRFYPTKFSSNEKTEHQQEVEAWVAEFQRKHSETDYPANQ